MLLQRSHLHRGRPAGDEVLRPLPHAGAEVHEQPAQGAAVLHVRPLPLGEEHDRPRLLRLHPVLLRRRPRDVPQRLAHQGNNIMAAKKEASPQERKAIAEASKKAGYAFDIESVDVPIPKGDSDRHLYEAKVMFTAPAGFSMNDIYGAVVAVLLHGSKGKFQPLSEYGGGLKNKTLMSPEGRKLSRGAGMICTAFDNESIPKKATTIKVIRKKEEKCGKRG